ncbi:MAG TPA: DUF4350 domain-containing protein [Blastocatellia bacterium]|nr:DUF4350 domain-containing protein [Blastocatellia bacterium]
MKGLINLASSINCKIKNRRRFLAKALVLGALVFLFNTPAAAQVSVLVDASRDGGAWWFPQAEPSFDPALPHQGKALADFLRSQAMTVTELPRPSTITCELLSRYHLVIAIDLCGSYSASELAAYTRYVSNGGRLILLNDHKLNPACEFDSLSRALGLDFSGALTGTITTFSPHPITDGVATLLFVTGSAATTLPPGATILGSLSEMPVMGIMQFGSGQVFFLGDSNGIEAIPQPFTNNLFGFMLAGAQPVNACPVPTVESVIRQVAGLDLNAGDQHSLISKLGEAEDSIARGNSDAAINQFNAFINQVQALQRSRRLDSTTANQLIAAVQTIIESL